MLSIESHDANLAENKVPWALPPGEATKPIVIKSSFACDVRMIVSPGRSSMQAWFSNHTIKSFALAFAIVTTTHAETIRSISTFATGQAVNATGPDSITVGGGSVWVSYTNGADSTGVER
jgi:hypothetical protein